MPYSIAQLRRMTPARIAAEVCATPIELDAASMAECEQYQRVCARALKDGDTPTWRDDPTYDMRARRFRIAA